MPVARKKNKGYSGSLRDKGPGRWEYRYQERSERGTVQRSKTIHATGIRKAEAEARRIWEAVCSNKGSALEDHTVADLLEEFYRLHISRELAHETQQRYRVAIKLHLLPYLGHVRLQDLNAHTIERAYARLQTEPRRDGRGGPLSAGTVRYAHAVLRSALERAEDWGWIDANPAVRARPPRAGGRREVSSEVLASLPQILDAVAGTPVALPVALAMYAGLRVGEICALQMDDLDGKTLHVRHSQEIVKGRVGLKDPKSEAGRRSVPIPQILSDVLEEWMQQKQAGALRARSPYLYTWDDGRPVRKDFVEKKLRCVLQDAGLPIARMHDFRKIYISMMSAGGVGDMAISRYAGHSDLRLTASRYFQVTDEARARADEAVDKAFPRADISVSPLSRRAKKK